MTKLIKIINITDRFLINHKNKIMLAFIAFLQVCCIIYCTVSEDRVSAKTVMIFIVSAVFLIIFFGIAFVLRVRNKFMPLNLTAGYIYDMLLVIFALSVILAFIYDYILTFDGFNLIIFSVFSAFLNAVVSARVRNQKNK